VVLFSSLAQQHLTRSCIESQLALQAVDKRNVSLLGTVGGGTSIHLFLPSVVLGLALENDVSLLRIDQPSTHLTFKSKTPGLAAFSKSSPLPTLYRA
jgi:hypothetical protein